MKKYNFNTINGYYVMYLCGTVILKNSNKQKYKLYSGHENILKAHFFQC